ncbi:hypothetical protein Hanom_Chr05g00447051 [Helianthus anomalus]
MAGLSLLWHDNQLYPSFQRLDEEPGVLGIHLEQFILPVVPADPNAYISQPPPSGGSNVETKKPTQVKITERKVVAAGATTSPVAVSISTAPEGATAVYAPTSSFVKAQGEGVSFVPLTTGDVVSFAACVPSISDLISQASVVAVSSSMLPPMFTTVVSPVSTPLFSSSTPMSLFDSHIGVFSSSEKEMPITCVAGESTSTRDATVSDAGGSSSGFIDDGARLGDDLYLPTNSWDPNAQDKRYQPKWNMRSLSVWFSPSGVSLG